jgi:DNA-binding Lrp family transcriptional regulator
MASPSAQIVAAAHAPLVVRDAEGRELVLRRMTALDRLRLFKAIGPVLSQNNAYLGMAMLAACVVAIDTVPVPAPVTEGQVEGLVARLGDCGISAVAAALSQDDTPTLGSAAQGN